MFIQKRVLLLLLVLLSVIQVSARQMEDTVTAISIHAIAGLQYDLVRFKVKPGARVKIIFNNTDDMSHNLLITKPGARVQVVNAALQLEEKGPMMDYIPPSSQVLWAIPVISPGQMKSISFTAPREPGVYPYVCTFPGHGFVMYGAMYVTTDENLPDIKNDVNIPPSRRKENSGESKDHDMHSAHQTETPRPLHPYEPTAPYLYRVFMEDASPAAIAVSLPQELSYCWDAGTCHLRYAWQGGFVDNSDLWKGKPNAVAKIMGTIFFRDKTTYPLRIGTSEGIPNAEYKGYRLINRYPEFHYTLDGMDVYELIQSKTDGSGLIRTFRIPKVNKSIWFCYDPEDGMEYEASTGKWENNKLELSSHQARKFTISMTRKEGLQ